MPRVFLSYRRDDTAGVTGRIHDQLRSRFGDESVFRDVDSIPSGLNFRERLERAVSECDVLLVLIGERWLQADESGKRRLDNSDDYVRMEIALALTSNKPVLPVLVGRAPMPLQGELPADLAQLVYQNAVRVDHEWNFHEQIFKLIRDIEYIARKGPSAPIINTVFRIVKAAKVEDEPLPIWKFTLMNRSSSSQVLNHLDCNVVEYHPYLPIPKTRVLDSIAVWDIELPCGEGDFTCSPDDPVLVAADDAVTISLRFHCTYQGKWISPRQTAGYTIQVRFVTDQDLVAASDCIRI
jgi:hypothetical protein